MKKITYFLVAVFAFSTASFAQKIKSTAVPTVVKQSFAKAYPNAKAVQWDKEGNDFEASFEQGEIDYSVLYSAQGTVLEIEVEIETAALPANAIAYIKKNYAGQKIKEAAKLTNANGVITFEAELKGIDLIFSEIGQYIKTVKD